MFQASLNPLTLFMEADIVVKCVLVLLMLASIWSWAIILSQTAQQRRFSKRAKVISSAFGQSKNVTDFVRDFQHEDQPMVRVMRAGLSEWQISTERKLKDKQGLRSRMAAAFNNQIGEEIEQFASPLSYLATIGSTATFVGLFGTVWGIMTSFAHIAAEQDMGFSAVAPGISEALFATALGLFTAIPAVVGYNRLNQGVEQIEQGITRFAERFNTALCRELDV
jgi:biopolymer transport protein TolQ